MTTLRLVHPRGQERPAPSRGRLTEDERKNLSRTIRHLCRTTFPSMRELAREAGVPRGTLVQAAMGKPGRGSAALALRIARAARVTVEDVLGGKLVPALVVCVHCGAVREGGAS